jgi:hypothetical protein
MKNSFAPFLVGFSLLLSASFVFAQPLSEESCSVVVSRGDAKSEINERPGLKVLDRDPRMPFKLQLEDEDSIESVVCLRSEARFSRNDYLVPLAGYRLYVKTEGEPETLNRIVSLEYEGNSFNIRLVDGPKWTVAEEKQIIDLLSFFNSTVAIKPNKTIEPTR